MGIEELLRDLRQANRIASEALEETGNAQSAKWDEANKIESSIQRGLDFGGEGLLIEWSTAYSQYIIRAERE